MKTKCIAVRSVTYAQKAKAVLSEEKISGHIARKPQGTFTGCGWCIAVPAEQTQRALECLRKSGVKLTGEIYDLP